MTKSHTNALENILDRVTQGEDMVNYKTKEYEQNSLQMENVMEVLRVEQVLMERPVDYDKTIRSSTHAGQVGMKEIGKDASETVLVLALSTQNSINAIHRVFTGSLNSSVAHPREIFRSAILNNAARILIYHNHPSGNTSPSDADLSFTKRIVESGDMLGIDVMDHIIVSDEEYFSLKEHGMM